MNTSLQTHLMRRIWLTAAILSAATVVMAADTATIVIHPDKTLGPVKQELLGTNDLGYQWDAKNPKRVEYSNQGSGVWDPQDRRPTPELLKLAQEAGIRTLRWPGGCGSHLFRWKETIGPLDKRPHQQFGLHEFMLHCEALGADPMITVAEYYGTPQDAADMVEYLNSPVGANPNGGVDYAAIRAAMGHPAPWHVTWFEFGNESNHGDHHGRTYTPEEYAQKYHAYRAAMRAVDPSIKLGLVLANTTWEPEQNKWTTTVLRDAPDADFVIHHAYLPGYSSNDGKETPAQIFVNGFAVDAQFHAYYRQLDALVQRITGRRIPFAITEFNGAFVQEKPYPYRLTHANALVAGLIFTALLDPELPIARAEYWQFANEYWGAVKGYAPPYVARPAQLMFTLFHRYLGDTFVAADTTCGRFNVPGGFGVRRMTGAPQDKEEILGPVAISPWTLTPGKGFQHKVEHGVLEVEITDPANDINYYHASCTAPAEPGASYRLTGEIRAEGLNPARGAQLQLGDGRGWTATHSVAVSEMVNSPEWTPVSVDYQTLPDATSLIIQARRMENGGAAGKMAFRNLKLVRFNPVNLGAQPLLTTLASTRPDDSVLLLLIFNKDLKNASDVTVRVPGARSAAAESLVAPALESTNETDPTTSHIAATKVTLTGDAVRLTLAPFSLTGVRIATR